MIVQSSMIGAADTTLSCAINSDWGLVLLDRNEEIPQFEHVARLYAVNLQP